MALTPFDVLSLAASAFPLFFALVFIRDARIRAFFFPLVILGVHYTTTASDEITLWTWCALLATIACDLLIITDASKLCAPGQKTLPYDLPLGQRCKWALNLIISLRRIGWTREGSKNSSRPMESRPSVSRGNFLLHQLLEFGRVYLVMDIAHACMAFAEKFRDDPASSEIHRRLFRIIHSLAALVAAWGFTGLGYLLVTIVAVGVIGSDPNSWTNNIHGSWADAYTIRTFWGRVWHQLLRRVVSAHGGFVAHDVLRLSPGTFLANNVARFAGFYTSGLIHSYGFHGSLKHHWADVAFYIWQAAGIGLEELIMHVVPLRLTKTTRLLGYIWMLSWFSLTLPEYTEHQFGATVEAGCNNFRISAVMGLWKGEWLLD
ncbi:hypothetical protein K438DRAFT_1980986 [Mycena galopus ATCC 62051]|nr:hypothetical protein K438DRAFT_1980986 [Mycena galopus ATCC 62051]